MRSVHRAAITVDLDRPGALLTVAIDDVGGIPGGILVRGTTDLRGFGVEPGMAVLTSADGLTIAGAGLRIDASAARPWNAALPSAARLASGPTVIDELEVAVEIARTLAAGRAPSAGFGPLLVTGGSGDPWLDAARLRIERQTEALRADELEAAVEPTIGLIGLGTGLTPSGDDYLAGLLAGLDATGHGSRAAIASAIADAVPGRTTGIGAALLIHAARGEYAERLHDVLAAIALGRSHGLAVAIGRAMAYGATSGADSLVGVFAAIGVATSGRAEAAA